MKKNYSLRNKSCRDTPAVTSRWLSIAWTVCFGRSRPISVRRPTELHAETMKWVRKKGTSLRAIHKTERDANITRRHSANTLSTRCVLFLIVAKHVSEFVSMCLGTSEIMWLMIHELKTCGLRWDVKRFSVNWSLGSHPLIVVESLLQWQLHFSNDVFALYKSIQLVWYSY